MSYPHEPLRGEIAAMAQELAAYRFRIEEQLHGPLDRTKTINVLSIMDSLIRSASATRAALNRELEKPVAKELSHKRWVQGRKVRAKRDVTTKGGLVLRKGDVTTIAESDPFEGSSHINEFITVFSTTKPNYRVSVYKHEVELLPSSRGAA